MPTDTLTADAANRLRNRVRELEAALRVIEKHHVKQNAAKRRILAKAVKPHPSVVRTFALAKNDTPTVTPDGPCSTDTISGTPEELERKSRGPFSGL